MAKIYGLFGSMTGKLADTVMSVRNGEQLARKYQPVVYNPSTQAQVGQRAKLKLMSQLSAVMAPVIAMRRKGSVSSRNLFTKVNFPLASYSDDTASIDLDSVQLTSSVVAFPTLEVTRGAENITIAVGSSFGVESTFSRVVYAVFLKQTGDKLRFYTSKVISEAGTGNRFEATIPATTASLVVLGYGVRDNTEAARVVFGNMQAPTAEDVARLVTNSTLLESDVTLTETRGFTLPSA